jgi:hypothetical protein
MLAHALKVCRSRGVAPTEQSRAVWEELRGAATDIARNPDRIHLSAYKLISATMLATPDVCKVRRILYLNSPNKDHLHTSFQYTLYDTFQYALRLVYWHANPPDGTDLQWYPRPCV